MSQMPRQFLYKNGVDELVLDDPNPGYSPERVMQLYADTYVPLTTAKLEGPEVVKDVLQYRFVSTIGTKG